MGDIYTVILERDSGDTIEREVIAKALGDHEAIDVLLGIHRDAQELGQGYWLAYAVRESDQYLRFAVDASTADASDVPIIGTRCPVCLAWVGAGTSSARRPIRCHGCQTLVAVPPPETLQGSDEYWAENYGAPETWVGEEFAAQRRLEAVVRLGRLREERLPPSRLLEVGCGTGMFLNVCAAAGYSITGVEPSPAPARTAAALVGGDNVRCGLVSDVVQRGETWDVIVAFHVLEHTADPVGFLAELAGHLERGGVLLIEVPNGGCRDARRDGSAWVPVELDHHYFLPTKDSLRRLLENAGFSSIRISEYTTREYDGPGLWRRRRLGWALRARITASRDLLFAVAVREFVPSSPKPSRVQPFAGRRR